MVSCAWLWMYAAMAMMLLELAVPGFVIFFFGLAAMTVGLARFAFGEAFTMNWQLAAFSILSVVYLVLLRRWLKNVFPGEKASAGLSDEYVGRSARVVEEIPPAGSGRVVIGETEWTAVADAPIAAGAEVEVVSRSNLTVTVKRKQI